MKLSVLQALALTLTVTLLLTVTLSGPSRHTSDASKARAAVKITRLDERSGGTGVVLSSTDTESTVLTNSHVCGVVERGGIVQNDYHRGFVTSYTRSAIHDLCLITTSTSFRTSTALASEPAKLTSTAAVSGYPRLMPNIITRGSFGAHEIVSIMIGMRPCTLEELASQDPNVSAVCVFLGGFPIIRTYDAQFTGATIQAGNSGSGVYNERGELAGLVFAGSGDFGYGMIVPQEYVYNFVNSELHIGRLETFRPNTTVTLDAAALTGAQKFKTACKDLSNGNKSFKFLDKFCKMVSQDLIYNKD